MQSNMIASNLKVVFLSFLLICFSNLFVVIQSTATGDAQYGNMDGYFYVFAANSVYIIDPNMTETTTNNDNNIIKKITNVGPTTWGDSVYIRDQAQIKHYAFVSDSINNLVWVFDTDLQELVTSIKVGTRPVHIYAVSTYDEVWVHLDGEGAFDIFHMSQVRYRSSSGVIAKTNSASHGKLLVNPNLENTGFATNTGESNIHQISLFSREYLAPINMTLPTSTSSTTTSDSTFICHGTHGIDYSSVNSYLYVECSNPSTCTTPFTSPTTCTGSVWTVNTKTLQPVERLISPSLNSKYGGSFGIHGQIFSSPEEQYLLVVNKNLGIVSILRPLSNGNTEIIDVPILHIPGTVVFAAKDMSEAFGINPNPSNYIAVIALEEKSDTSGIVFIDMADVVIAFDAGATSLPTAAITYLLIGAGNSNRPLEKGSNFIMTPIYSITETAYTKVIIINVITQKTIKIIDIPKISKLLWVPVDKNELKYKISTLLTNVDTLESTLMETKENVIDLQTSVLLYTNTANSNNNTQDNNNNYQAALILGAMAFILSIISILAIIILYCSILKTRRGYSNGGGNISGIGSNHHDGYLSSEKNSFMA